MLCHIFNILDHESVILDRSSVFKSKIKQKTHCVLVNVIGRETRIENKSKRNKKIKKNYFKKSLVEIDAPVLHNNSRNINMTNIML